MKPAEFEERAYEAPLYNQLERGNRRVFSPGQVLENYVGFDRGIAVAEQALWDVLGYKAPPCGIALDYYDWPTWFRIRHREQPTLPRFRLNLFLQAKRPHFHSRRPRRLRALSALSVPYWSFDIQSHQQEALHHLAERSVRRAHVAYAAPAFHTYKELFAHTTRGTIVRSSTFPSTLALAGHHRWYYSAAGAKGVANPEPETIEELSLIERLDHLSMQQELAESLSDFLQGTAEDAIASVVESSGYDGPLAAKFIDDLRMLDRLLDPYDLPSEVRSFSRVRLFSERYALSWLIYDRAE